MFDPRICDHLSSGLRVFEDNARCRHVAPGVARQVKLHANLFKRLTHSAKRVKLQLVDLHPEKLVSEIIFFENGVPRFADNAVPGRLTEHGELFAQDFPGNKVSFFSFRQQIECRQLSGSVILLDC